MIGYVDYKGENAYLLCLRIETVQNVAQFFAYNSLGVNYV